MKKKYIKRSIVSVFLLVSLLFGTFGCAEQANQTTKKPVDVPDYSDSEKEMYIYAHRSGSNGVFNGPFGEQIIYEDYTSLESMKRFKDCGFNVFYSQVSAHYYTGEDFETSYLKKYLDMCEELGLKMIVEDKRIFTMCQSTESLIGEGKQFATIEDLANTLAEYMKPYINHPAFFGVVTEDEPMYVELQAVSEVTRALRMVKEDIWIKNCLFPLGGLGSLQSETFYTGRTPTIGATIDDYIYYTETFMELSGAKWLGYDKYPFASDGFNDLFNANLQIAAEIANKYDANLEVVLQSFGMDKGDGSSVKVLPDLNELYLQNNLALSFGVKNIGYFTYWRPGTGGDEVMTGGIIDYDGQDMIYDEVQEVIAYTRKIGAVTLNFDYEKAYWTYDKDADITAPRYFTSLKSEQLDKVEVGEVTQPTIVTQLFDETNNRRGYMVVNALATSDYYSMPDEVPLTFEGYGFVTYYSKEEPKTVPLVDGKITLTLGEGEAAFVIPHN